MRNTDWPMLFEAYIESRRHVPFSWGKNDCCFFAAGWYEACTGSEITKDWEDKYSTALGAAKVLEAHGGLANFVDQHLERHINPNFAGVGDIVLVMNEGRALLAICNGSVVFAPGESAMMTLPMSMAVVAWKV